MTKVSKMASSIKNMIKANPDVLRDEIINYIDSKFVPNMPNTVMRRTYDVLNILKEAGVVVESNKRYRYDPYVLEGA